MFWHTNIKDVLTSYAVVMTTYLHDEHDHNLKVSRNDEEKNLKDASHYTDK